MDIQARRLAMVTAILMSGFGAVGSVEAGPMLMTPAGLSPGDHFRFVFVTDGTTTATSSGIADYNNFVNAQADGATYNGMTVGWAAIASTTTVNAIDNVGQTPDPVYLVDGSRVATGTTISGLWSGSLLHAINLDLTGAPLSAFSYFAWTGTRPDGTADPVYGPLGSSVGSAGTGDSTSSTAIWVQFAPSNTLGENHVYGISADLIVPMSSAVPEPSTLGMAVVAIGVGLACGWHRHGGARRPGLGA